MTFFYLPDLGEGLPDAEIHAWFVHEGESVVANQPLVAMETAKAVVEIPCPEDGVINTLYGKPGDVIKTGARLVEYLTNTESLDEGTVVGQLEQHSNVRSEHLAVGAYGYTRIKATPTIRRLAQHAGINLRAITPTGEYGTITREDINNALAIQTAQASEGFEPLNSTRRAMLNNMTLSHQHVVPVSLFDEVDVSEWIHDGDITVRLIRAMVAACQEEPALNAWFDTATAQRKCFSEVNIGLAMDNSAGLFVPVISNATQATDSELRASINAYKHALVTRSLPPTCFQGASITLSNFGKFSGRFATPLIIPPTVAILAVGRLYTGIVSVNDTIESRKLLPLSLSFDHRAVTGGEATRFLGVIMRELRAFKSSVTPQI